MKAKLLIRKGLASGQEIALSSESLVIGRGEEADLRLPDRAASRRHCVISPTVEGWSIQDLDSKNGTCVNGLPVSEMRLTPGDLIQLGLTTLQLVADDAPSAEETHVFSAFGDLPEETLSIAPDAGPNPDEERRFHKTVTEALGLVEGLPSGSAPGTLLAEVVERLVSMTGAMRGAAIVFAPQTRRVRFRAVHSPLPGDTVPLQREAVDRCIDEGEGLLYPNLTVDPGAFEAEHVTDLFYSALYAPLAGPDGARGVIYLDSLGGGDDLHRHDLDAAVWAGRAAGLRLIDRPSAPPLPPGTEGGESFGMIGASPTMGEVFALIRKAAHGASTVLIRGESGTGKELVARAFHRYSPRREGPFVAVNCAAIPAGLVESELFGFEKGAFTGAASRRAGRFESAHGGVLFLDEIGELPLQSQGKILRAVEEKRIRRLGGTEEKEVDARLVAATNLDLEKEVHAGHFRADLFYRLSVITIDVPPLRERTCDIPLLANYFLEFFREETGHKVTAFTPEAMALLNAYPWPGNVRELRNAVERTLVLGRGSAIEASDLSFLLRGPLASPPELLSLREVEKTHIRMVLDHLAWNKSHAARTLGIERSTLYEKIKLYGLEMNGSRP
jgi:transcriptional regulator with AAA-type ATPase domain